MHRMGTLSNEQVDDILQLARDIIPLHEENLVLGELDASHHMAGFAGVRKWSASPRC
jgi:hypothetical protein